MKNPTHKDFLDCAKRLKAVTDPVILELSFLDAFLLVAQLQLALRHPGNTGESAELVRATALVIQEGLASRVPCVLEVLASGWDSEKQDDSIFFFQELPMLKKKQVVANCHTLGQACAALSRIVDDGRSPEDWFATLSLQSVYWLETLPDREVNRIIQEIDEGSMFTT